MQKDIVMRCRQAGKPVIVASHLLQSMIEYPTPTRAEVADIADVVRQRADALMLSGESAAGQYPEKAIGVLRAVATRIEEWCRYLFWFRSAQLIVSNTGSCQISTNNLIFFTGQVLVKIAIENKQPVGLSLSRDKDQYILP